MSKKIQVRSQPVIRPATAMDAANIVRLIKEGWEQTPAHKLAELDELKLLEYVGKTLQHSFAIVAEHSGRILGTVALAPIQVPWCEQVVLAESWLAVRAEHRESLAGKLLDAVETFLDRNRIPCFMGTQMLTPGSFNALIAKRNRFQPSRHTFLRMPVKQFKEDEPNLETLERKSA